MAAGDNEKKFLKYIRKKYSDVDSLQATKTPFTHSEGDVEVEYDFIFNLAKNKQVLIEVNSYTSHKPLVGEYIITNEILKKRKLKKEDYFIIIISYYKQKMKTPHRAETYLRYIERSVYKNKGVKFKVFSNHQFYNLAREKKTFRKLLESIVCV